MHEDEKFNEFLRREMKDYQTEVPPPAEAIWASIERDVEKAIRPRVVQFPVRRVWIAAGVGIAATLMIGVAVGRWSNTQSPTTLVARAPAPDDSARKMAYAEAATINHLAETEVFLTAVRADLKADRSDTHRGERSRELLARTRLLLGSSAQNSPALEQLLEDLELLLAEIAATPKEKNSMDTKILDETMRQGNLLPRIRATLPAPTSA